MCNHFLQILKARLRYLKQKVKYNIFKHGLHFNTQMPTHKNNTKINIMRKLEYQQLQKYTLNEGDYNNMVHKY